ncbi:MAG: hypothetical protein HY903_00175 [Deltaproteobacteria bacterium]|nr:hypothetical protein [Deltaproteobacteria bacterium]
MKPLYHLRIGLVLPALCACGNLSNEDLLFIAAVPKKAEVELKVAAGGSQTRAALTSADAVGDDAELYKTAAKIATDVNAGVGAILDLVDSLGKGHPPTRRTDNARIWGPVSNVDGKGTTFRLEIRRDALEGGAPRFVFCFAVARDAEVKGDAPTCLTPDENGFHTFLSGHYDPQGEQGGARSGSGSITLNFEAAWAAGIGKPEDRGVLTLVYDFSQGGESKQIHVDVSKPATLGTLPGALGYDYGRDADAHVDFMFTVENYLDPNKPGTPPQTFTIDAAWQEGVAGRADAVGRGGDLQPDQYAVYVECWDGAAKRTYLWGAVYKGTLQQAITVNEGSAASCPQ